MNKACILSFLEQSTSFVETRKRPPFTSIQRHFETWNQYKTNESEGRSSINDAYPRSVRRQLRRALLSDLTMCSSCPRSVVVEERRGGRPPDRQVK